MSCPPYPASSLRFARAGDTVRVTRLSGQPALCYRLREMGFCEMAKVRVMQNNGTVICHVCGSKVGLSRELAAAIFVEPSGV
ncbi:MAG: FeoA family protein [Verrucomicrobiales bacterium]